MYESADFQSILLILPEINLKNGLSLWEGGEVDGDLPVEPPWPQQSLVQDVHSIGRCQHDHTLQRMYACCEMVIHTHRHSEVGTRVGAAVPSLLHWTLSNPMGSECLGNSISYHLSYNQFFVWSFQLVLPYGRDVWWALFGYLLAGCWFKAYINGLEAALQHSTLLLKA